MLGAGRSKGWLPCKILRQRSRRESPVRHSRFGRYGSVGLPAPLLLAGSLLVPWGRPAAALHAQVGDSLVDAQRPPCSCSGRRPRAGPPAAAAPSAPSSPSADDAAPSETPAPPPPPARPSRLRAAAARHERPLLVGLGTLLALAAMLVYGGLQPRARALTQDDIDKAVLHTLETQVLPSQAAQAYEKIAKSVVRVRGLATGREP